METLGTNGVRGLSVPLCNSEDCGPWLKLTVLSLAYRCEAAPPTCKRRSVSSPSSYHGSPTTRAVYAQSFPSPTSVPVLSVPDRKAPTWTNRRRSSV